jgi:agmatinase
MIMGGDDSVPIPVLDAYENHGPITVFQIDAHIDWRDAVAGERFGLSSNMRRASEMGWVDNIIQVGARGIGSARLADYEDASNWGVQFFPMHVVAAEGIAPIVEAVPKNAKVFVTLDIDGMDPAVVPAVIGPAPGGLDYWQVVSMMKGIAGKSQVAGFDLVELMPGNDVGGRGALVAARMMAVMMGLIAQQR